MFSSATSTMGSFFFECDRCDLIIKLRMGLLQSYPVRKSPDARIDSERGELYEFVNSSDGGLDFGDLPQR